MGVVCRCVLVGVVNLFYNYSMKQVRIFFSTGNFPFSFDSVDSESTS